MKNKYSIGRSKDCDIVLNDYTNVVSRYHAVLKVDFWGNYSIIDISRNGTYVNGVRINPNVEVPISKKDSVTFARVCKLDWSRVPNTRKYVFFSTYLSLAFIVLLFCGYILTTTINRDDILKNNFTQSDVSASIGTDKGDTHLIEHDIIIDTVYFETSINEKQTEHPITSVKSSETDNIKITNTLPLY